MLNYTEISDLCMRKGMLLKDLVGQLDMTLNGFRSSIDNQTLQAKKIMPLCKLLGISLAEFFGIRQDSDINYGNMQKGGKKNTMSVGGQELQQTIDILRDQLKKKDDQIDKLLTRL